MPKNCRLSFHQNLILTQQTSIPIMKFEVLWAYEEVSAKIAMWGNPMGTCQKGVLKNFQVAWRIRKGPDPKIFGVIWERLWAPSSGHPRKFLIHAQSWLKPAVDFPLNRNFRCPKRPPLGSERVFFKLGYLGVRYCPPWPSFVKIRRPPSVQSGPVRAGKPVKGLDLLML